MGPALNRLKDLLRMAPYLKIGLAFGGGGEPANDRLQRHRSWPQIVDDAGVSRVLGIDTYVRH